MLQLRCAAQNYDWGRPAEESEVAKLAQANGGAIDTTKPFAELWMGTHPKCPSTVLGTETPLQDVLAQSPVELLGPAVAKAYGPQLPFLFKVLSVAKALSIQAHPDKHLAERLHAQAPQLYPDDNHKPEMALALGGGMEALCGFVPLHDLQHHLAVVPELASCVGDAATSAVQALSSPCKQTLRAAFEALMNCDRKQVSAAVNSLVQRLQAGQPPQAAHAQQPQQPGPNEDATASITTTTTTTTTTTISSSRGSGGSPASKRLKADGVAEAGGTGASASTSGSSASGVGGLSAQRVELALRLARQFPGDVGVLASFFLNLVHLPGGSALALGANEPHAYLSGELVECMATSDNVMRAGLTPKPLDVTSLVNALTYTQGPADVLPGSPSGIEGLRLYRPPFQEFEVQRLTVQPSAALDLPASQGPRLILVQHGAAQLSSSGAAAASHVAALQARVPAVQGDVDAARGSVVFVAAGVDLRVAAGEEGMEAWVAAVNSTFFVLSEVEQRQGQGAAPAAAQATAVL